VSGPNLGKRYDLRYKGGIREVLKKGMYGGQSSGKQKKGGSDIRTTTGGGGGVPSSQKKKTRPKQGRQTVHKKTENRGKKKTGDNQLNGKRWGNNGVEEARHNMGPVF